MTPRQLKLIKEKYPGQDDYLILLGVFYLQRNLSDEAFESTHLRLLNEVFGSAASTSEVTDELKLILSHFTSTILPTIKYLKLNALTNSEALTLSAKLTAHSAYSFVMSDTEIGFAENPTLQAASQLINRTFNEKNDASPRDIKKVLNSLFEKFPETEQISAFNDLMLQAELLTDGDGEENSMIDFAKETLNLRKRIGANYLQDALAAFKQWKKNHRTHLGVLRKIIEQVDRLVEKYPSAKHELLEFSFVMFKKMLVDKELLLKYCNDFSTLVSMLINLNDKHIVFSLCFHLANENSAFPPWMLIEILNHPIFQTFTPDQCRVILNMISKLLNHNFHFSNSHVRFILDKCQHRDARIMILQCLNGLYLNGPYPTLATIIEWIKPVANKDLQGLNTALSNGYLNFRNAKAIILDPTSMLLEKQLNKLRHDLNDYLHTSFLHTRKNRAAYLNQLSIDQLNSIDAKSSDERKILLQQTILELYLHYSTIENASGILSRALEKRLIKLLQIPNDISLQNAIEMRNRISYKIHTFFCAGRSIFKSYRDKEKDPVHGIILEYLSPELLAQIKNAHVKIKQLDQLDSDETSLLGL